MSRADRVSARLAERGLDALLVTDAADLRYLTGFTGSNGYAVVGAGLRRFVTDFRYVERARTEVADFDREQGPREILGALADGWPVGSFRLGFDDADVSVRAHGRLRDTLPERIELVAAGDVVEAERAVKEPLEIERLQAAAALADEVYGWVVQRGLVGRTERAVAVALEHRMRELGADGPSFDSIVASGELGALPHAEPRDVEIPRDTLVTLDIGARLDGYCSDCTRTLATGDLPDATLEAYDLVRQAQLAGLDAVTAGTGGREADSAAREVIGDAGHAEHFGHGLGHGVGLEIHEAPRLSQRSDSVLASGNVVTVEPGVYLPGQFGVRIEDLVVVTDTACRILTSVPKELITVG